MSEERVRILNLVSEGKLTPEEAEKLLQAMEKGTQQVKTTGEHQSGDVRGKYLYIQVEPKEGKSAERVSVKVPLALVKAGLNISKLIPKEAQETIRSTMQDSGIPFDFSDIDDQNLQEILEALEEMSIDVDTEESSVKVFCR
ncbi:MAG: SHOCT-like domain-containing protein [Sphaerochaetaceae bacterium]